MSLASQARSAIRRSDRKAAKLLGVTLTRDHHPIQPKRTLVDALRMRLGFPRKKHVLSAESSQSDSDSESEYEQHIVWDEPNPFGPPDPSQARLRALIQAEIARTARYESIGPLDRVHDDEDSDDATDEDEDDADADDEDEDYDEDDFDSEDDQDDGWSESEADDDNKPATIVLPRLLPIPLRFIPSMHTLRPPPPPPPSPTPSSPVPSDDEEPAPWADIAEAYNDIAEADERARKAKRDAHRSRSKALAILGPEASSVL